MSEELIAKEVFDRLADFELPVRYPNVQYGEQTEAHCRASVLPAETDSFTLAGSVKRQGIIQVSIYMQQGIGDIIPRQYADTVIQLFPRGLDMAGVRVHRQGWASPGFIDGAWWVTPVTIPYHLFE